MIKGIILDIDGVLEFQEKVYPYAVETIRALRYSGYSLRFLTNSTLKSRASCADGLRKKGFIISDDEIITASYATANYLRNLKPRSCWVMLDGKGRDEFNEFVQDLKNPEYLVIGDNRSCFDFDHLNHVLRLLRNGTKLIGMQSELVDTSMGEVELNVGSWVGMLERASGVRAIYIGKPNPFVFELSLRTMNLSTREIVVVGDRVSTDIAGAYIFGLRSVLVKTGEFNPSDLNTNVHPDFIVDSIRDIPSILNSF
jgi:HAD superfamily hydrolase (TIGR01458 family)